MKVSIITALLHTVVFTYSQVITGEDHLTLFQLIESCRENYGWNIVFNPRDIHDRILESEFNHEKGKKAFVSYLQSLGYTLIVNEEYIVIKSYSAQKAEEGKKDRRQISQGNQTNMLRDSDSLKDSICRANIPPMIITKNPPSLKTDIPLSTGPDILYTSGYNAMTILPSEKAMYGKPISLYAGMSAGLTFIPKKDVIYGIASEIPTKKFVSINTDLDLKHFSFGLEISGYQINATSRDSGYTQTVGDVTMYNQYHHRSRVAHISLNPGYSGILSKKIAWTASTGISIRLWEQVKNICENCEIGDSLISDIALIQSELSNKSIRFLESEYPDVNLVLSIAVFYKITPIISLAIRARYLSSVRQPFKGIRTDNFMPGIGLRYLIKPF